MAKKKDKDFPDFSGDGKVTKKDVLMGKGIIPKPGHKKKDEDDEANEWFVDEVMNRVEENILKYEELFESILAEAEAEGIDIEALTEEELSELFGFGMDRSTSRSRTAMARRGTGARTRRAMGRIARKQRQRGARRPAAQQAASQKPADEKPATKTTDKKDPATGTTLTKGKAKGRRPAPPKPGQMGKPGTRDPATGLLRQSTDIVRGARLALAERVLKQMKR